ncbi:MAG: roadblock/LC7 domain-containing protein [Euryarchaeota archaeon]|nr:roadblock/LC7 domain-containing protein [Euryarchaeota archaeon]
MTTMNALSKTLSDLHNRAAIEASAIISRNGVLVTANAPKDASVFAAMAATMLGAAEITAEGLNRGLPDRMIVESRHGRLIVMGAGRKMLLATLIEPNTNLGMVLVELEKTIKNIVGIVEPFHASMN